MNSGLLSTDNKISSAPPPQPTGINSLAFRPHEWDSASPVGICYSYSECLSWMLVTSWLSWDWMVISGGNQAVGDCRSGRIRATGYWRHRGTVTLYDHSVRSPPTVTLYGHPVRSLCTATLHGHSVQSLCTITLYGHSARSLCMVTLYGHSVRLLCAVTLYSHSVRSLCATRCCNHKHYLSRRVPDGIYFPHVLSCGCFLLAKPITGCVHAILSDWMTAYKPSSGDYPVQCGHMMNRSLVIALCGLSSVWRYYVR